MDTTKRRVFWEKVLIGKSQTWVLSISYFLSIKTYKNLIKYKYYLPWFCFLNILNLFKNLEHYFLYLENSVNLRYPITEYFTSHFRLR